MAAKNGKLKFHEIANSFPLIEGEEFDQLVADIAANGLLDPIMLHEGKILDGRNRYRACVEAGVEVRTVEWSGESGSPEGYVLSRETRRHLTKGQRAMGVARLFPEPEKGGRGRNSKLSFDFAPQYLSRARFVLHNAPDLVDPVLIGAKPLNAAYDEAKDREREARSEQEQLAKLRETHPELATKVEEGDLSIEQARALQGVGPEYWPRIWKGQLSVPEAEALQARDEAEHRKSIARAADALRSVIYGWPVAKNMRKNALREEILGELSKVEAGEFESIEREMKR